MAYAILQNGIMANDEQKNEENKNFVKTSCLECLTKGGSLLNVAINNQYPFKQGAT